MVGGMILVGLGPVLFLIGTVAASIFLYGTCLEQYRLRKGKNLSFVPKLLLGMLSVLVSGLGVATLLWSVLNWLSGEFDS